MPGGSPGSRQFKFSDESLLCASPVRNRSILSSRDSGWQSLLLDHQEGREACEAYDKPVTPDLCLTISVSGSYKLAVYKQGRWRHAVSQAGSISITRGGEGSRLRWEPARPHASFETLSLYLPTLFLAEAADHFRRPGQADHAEPASTLILDDRSIAEAAVAGLRALRSGASDFYAERLAAWLAVQLVWVNGGRNGSGSEDRSPGTISDKRLARVVDYMTSHSHLDLTLRGLAEIAGVSPYHFHRLFQKAVGRTPFEFLTDHRIEMGRGLLETTDLAVAEIALACGYTRATAFTAAFTRRLGIAPRRWRDERRR